MTTFVYKAYDQLGNKKAGTLAVASMLDARRELRERGLSAYLIEDLRAFKKALRKRKKRRQILAIVGVVSISLAMLGSGLMVGYAGRDRALTVEEYEAAGVVKGGSGNVVADTQQGRDFASDIYNAWQSFAPGAILGIEVRRGFMTIYVGKKISLIGDEDLEVLATNSARASQRQFGSSGSNVLIIRDDVPILEVRYNGITKSTKITSYK